MECGFAGGPVVWFHVKHIFKAAARIMTLR